MQQLNQLMEIIKSGAKRGRYVIFEGAEEEEIEKLEKSLGIKLPLSFRKFLIFSNGALLDQTDEIFGTKDEGELQTSILTIRTNLPSLPKNLIPFAMTSVYNCFDIRQEGSEYPVMKWREENNYLEKSASSFPDWLEKKFEQYL